MSDDDIKLGTTVPLDSDGFLRRECPTCEREFKWQQSADDGTGAETVPDGGYFCPYCGVQAPADSWFTQAQLALAQNMIETEVLAPMIEDFARDIERSSSRSRGMIKATVTHDVPDQLDPLTETDDMRRVDFPCHTSEPVKVLDDWTKPVHCLICGESSL
jgi:uncharacterized Zn finger protein (UPF0148 family)